MFCEIAPHVLASYFPISENLFLFYPVFHPIKHMSVALDIFCLTVVGTMPSATELSVLLGLVVGGNQVPVV